MTPGELLAVTTRRDVRTGEEVAESVHTGHLVLLGPDGEVVASVGDPDTSTFVRSAAKPFQATACLELLYLSADSLSVPEVAIACASHRAEPNQIEAVRRLLRHTALSPSALTCPADRGLHDPGAEPTPLLHNCSGKHAMFAFAAMHQGTGRERLLDPDGPLQRVVLEVLEEVFGPPTAVAVDGCGAPTVAVPLAAIAGGYRRLAVEPRWERVRDAMLARPDLVGGEGRLETALLGAGVVAKPGAEGVHAAAWVGRDGRPRSLAVRAADGASRATGAVMAAVLTDLGVVTPSTWLPPAVLGGGQPAGMVQVSDAVTALGQVVPDAR